MEMVQWTETRSCMGDTKGGGFGSGWYSFYGDSISGNAAGDGTSLASVEGNIPSYERHTNYFYQKDDNNFYGDGDTD